MEIRARVLNRVGFHQANVETAGRVQTMAIPPKDRGQGSSVSGGELLLLALATCYCNDVYREAAKQNLRIDEVGVEVSGEFGKEGEAARSVRYRVKVRSPEPADRITDLLRDTDTVAEVQNSLRHSVMVELVGMDVTPV